MSETPCIHCGATDEPGNGIDIRFEETANGGGRYPVCNFCEPMDWE